MIMLGVETEVCELLVEGDGGEMVEAFGDFWGLWSCRRSSHRVDTNANTDNLFVHGAAQLS